MFRNDDSIGGVVTRILGRLPEGFSLIGVFTDGWHSARREDTAALRVWEIDLTTAKVSADDLEFEEAEVRIVVHEIESARSGRVSYKLGYNCPKPEKAAEFRRALGPAGIDRLAR